MSYDIPDDAVQTHPRSAVDMNPRRLDIFARGLHHPDLERPDDLFARTLEIYKRGMPRGDPPGWVDLDELYSVKTGQLTVITGWPHSGKSEFLDAMLVNLAERGDWSFAYYSPENHPTETHVAKLLEKRVGKPFFPGPSERMSATEVSEGMDWVHEHFAWMAPQYTDYRTLFAVAETFRRPGAGKFGVILDPWNTLEHERPKDMSETEYIGAALTDVINWTRLRNIHVFIVAHPAKMMRDPKTGKRPVPTPYDLAGSANWYNRSDNIICIHREQEAMTPEVQVHVQKVRHKYIGHIGEIELLYDRATGRYRNGIRARPEEPKADNFSFIRSEPQKEDHGSPDSLSPF